MAEERPPLRLAAAADGPPPPLPAGRGEAAAAAEGGYPLPGPFWPELQAVYGSLLQHLTEGKAHPKPLAGDPAGAPQQRELIAARDARIQALETQLLLATEQAARDKARLGRALDRLQSAEDAGTVARLQAALGAEEEERRRLRAEVEALQATLQAAKTEASGLETQRLQGVAERARLEAALAAAQAEGRGLAEDARAAAAAAERLRAAVGRLEAEHHTVQAQLQEAQWQARAREEKAAAAVRGAARDGEAHAKHLALLEGQLQDRDTAVQQLRAEASEGKRQLQAVEDASVTLKQEVYVLRQEVEGVRQALLERDRQLEAARAGMEERLTRESVQEERLRRLQESLNALQAEAASLQQAREAAQREAEKLRGQRAEDQQRLDKLRAANAALRGELGAASRLAERRARDGAGRVKAAALVAAHAQRLAAVQCYYRWVLWATTRRQQRLLLPLAQLVRWGVAWHRQHVAFLRLRTAAVLERRAKGERQLRLLTVRMALADVLRTEVEARSALLLEEVDACRDLRTAERVQRHQLRLIAAQKRMLKEFLADLPTRFPEAIDMDDLFDYTVRRCGAMLPGFAVYVGEHDRATGHLRFQHLSDSCSEEMRTGACTRDLRQRGALSVCVAAHRRVHVANVHAAPGSDVVTSLTSAPVTPGDFYAQPLVLPDGEVPAVLCCDTCRGNRVTVQPENVPRDGVDADGVRHMTEYQLDFFAQLCDILAKRAFEIDFAELADLRRIGRDPFSFTPLDLYREAARVIFERVGPDSNVYVSVLDSFQRHATVVAQCCKEGSRHTAMLGKYLTRTRSPPGVTFDFCERRHKTDRVHDNHFLFPNEAADDRIVPYVQRWGDPPGAEAPRKVHSDCLLLLGLRSGSNMVMGVVGVEAAMLTKVQIQAIRRVVDVLNGYGPSLVRHYMMAQMGRQCLQWIRFNTKLDYGYLSLTDHFGNFRVLVTTKPAAHLRGQQLAWGEGVSAGCLQGGQPLYFPSVQEAVHEGPRRPRFFRKAMEFSDGQLLLCPALLGRGEEGGLGGRPASGAIVVFDTVGVRPGQKAEIDPKDQAVIAQATQILEELFLEVVEDETFPGPGETPLKLEELVGSTHVRFLKRVFMHANREVLMLNNESVMEIARYNVPPAAVGRVMYALLHLLGKVDARQPAWKELRNFVKVDVLRQVQAFDPTAATERRRFLRAQQALLSFTDERSVGGQASVPIARLYEWTNVAIMLWVASGQIRELHARGELAVQLADRDVDVLEDVPPPVEGDDIPPSPTQ